jgi:hypothetical protein
LTHNGYREDSSPKLCGISAIFKPLPKVNNHLLGENSPNLVTLAYNAYSAMQINILCVSQIVQNKMP